MDLTTPNKNHQLGLVINYFTNYASKESHGILASTTELSIRLLKINPVINSIVLVDGSKIPDEKIKKTCDELGVLYHHTGKEISYVKAYNIGWRLLKEPYIALMANDIVPFPIDSLKILYEWIQKPDIGCVFPYFCSTRTGGDEVQRLGFWRRGNLSCEPSSMTLNLNLFKRSILEEIGGLDENYIGAYAEPILLIKIRSLGYGVVLAGNAKVFHYDTLTKELGESTINNDVYLKDTNRWFKEYPQHAIKNGLAHIDLRKKPFSNTFLTKLLWTLVYKIPFYHLRRISIVFTMWIEPFLTRYPVKSRKTL